MGRGSAPSPSPLGEGGGGMRPRARPCTDSLPVRLARKLGVAEPLAPSPAPIPSSRPFRNRLVIPNSLISQRLRRDSNPDRRIRNLRLYPREPRKRHPSLHRRGAAVRRGGRRHTAPRRGGSVARAAPTSARKAGRRAGLPGGEVVYICIRLDGVGLRCSGRSGGVRGAPREAAVAPSPKAAGEPRSEISKRTRFGTSRRSGGPIVRAAPGVQIRSQAGRPSADT